VKASLTALAATAATGVGIFMNLKRRTKMRVKDLIYLLKDCDQESIIEVSLEHGTGRISHHSINFISYGNSEIPNFINIQEDNNE
jgi:hypothetical protein